MERHNSYCIILAGGVGRRLWPVSRKNLPKQFLDFFGSGRTLLQMTYDRFARFIPREHIIVSTFQKYVPLVREQLPDVAAENILAEPVQLSTMPAAVWGAFHILLRDPDACIVTTPADQHIVHDDLFEKDVLDGLDFVAGHKEFLAMGVRPTVPNTAYGYIQMGAATECPGMYRVKSFSEKPELEFANLFVNSREFLWNTGIFLWGAGAMAEMYKYLPPTVAQYMRERKSPILGEEEKRMVEHYYPSNSNSSIDLRILEECEHVYVKECNFGWADVGCWPELHEVARKDVDGNTRLGSKKVIFSGTRNTIVSVPDGMGAMVKGLDGFLVAQNENMLVICPNDDPALVRRLADEAQMKLGDEFL